jgi:hypothetical protein
VADMPTSSFFHKLEIFKQAGGARLLFQDLKMELNNEDKTFYIIAAG